MVQDLNRNYNWVSSYKEMLWSFHRNPNSGHENVMPTQEYVRKVIQDASEGDHFTRGPWLSAVVYLHVEGIMESGCLGDMKKYCKNGKLERVVGVIMSYTPNALGDLTVTLKDPSGTMGCIIITKFLKRRRVTQGLSTSELF
ncbi:reverse transcriptase domain-containing protein [Tanacetum coccineum]|uniref:Reverse transcriptase domain-containing protein n=1 Tax=Tanacetum coccineum TaxID=301880 RepID=A0ABQ5GUE4_9ASTR